MKETLKILIICNSTTSGVAYHRQLVPINYMIDNLADNDNIECLMLPVDRINIEAPELNLVNIVHTHANCTQYPILMDKLLEMQKKGCKLIMDLDDWFIVPESNPHHKDYNERVQPAIRKYINKFDAYTTTTKLYKDEIKKIIGAKNKKKKIMILPNIIDQSIEQFHISSVNKDIKRLRIGMVGGISHIQDVKLLEGLVSSLGDYNKHIQ